MEESFSEIGGERAETVTKNWQWWPAVTERSRWKFEEAQPEPSSRLCEPNATMTWFGTGGGDDDKGKKNNP